MEPTLKDILRRREALQAMMDKALCLQDFDSSKPLQVGDMQLCGDCTADFDRLVDTKCKSVQDNVKMYILAKSKLEEHIRENSELNERQLNDEIKEMNAVASESQMILDSLTNDYNSLIKEISNNQSLLGLIQKNINDEMQQVDATARELYNVDSDLQYLVELGNNSNEEILYLTEMVQQPNRIDPLVSIMCSPEVPYAGIINGIRLSYCELPEIDLFWLEINMAWGILGLSLCVLRNKNSLADTLRFRVKCNEAAKFMHLNSIKISPLKDKTMLTISYFNENVENNLVSAYHKETLWLEGDSDDYDRAITALAAVLAMTIIELNLNERVDPSCTALITILDKVKKGEPCGYEHVTEKGVISPSKRCNLCNVSHSPTAVDAEALVRDIVYTLYQICK